MKEFLKRAGEVALGFAVGTIVVVPIVALVWSKVQGIAPGIGGAPTFPAPGQ